MHIQTNGISTHYQIEGPKDAPVVILSHSLAANLKMWDAQLPALLPDFQVLRYDLRGHGQSESPKGEYTLENLSIDLFGLLDGLEIDRVHFVGLSLGGMIGQTSILKNPDRFLSVSLCDTTSNTPPAALPIWEDRIVTARNFGMTSMVQSTIDRWFSSNFQHRQASEVERVRDMIRSTSIDGYCGCSRAIMKLNLTNQLSRITLPTLLMVGQDDPGTPVGVHKIIQEQVDGSDLFVIPNALHLCNIEQDQIFNNRLLSFLKSVTHNDQMPPKNSLNNCLDFQL
jgi:3-oxoadipate enol-lactonase